MCLPVRIGRRCWRRGGRHAEGRAAGRSGDEIVTIGGLHATVVAVDDDVVTVEISPGVNARYARPAIARVLNRQSTIDEPVAPVEDDEPVQSPIIETRKND